MDAIFREAERVLVWLGFEDATDEVQALMEINRISDRYFTIWTEGFNSKLQILKELEQPLANGAMQRFLSRSWFERVWTVQECVLARDLEFYIGACTLELEPFENAVAMLADLYELSAYATVCKLITGYTTGTPS